MHARGADVDLLIRGAGPVGCALALALAGSPLRVRIGGAEAPRAAFRPIALSYASRLILERIGVWQSLTATPIETIRVSQQGRFGRTRIEASDAGVPALGYVVDYGALLSSLTLAVEKAGVEKGAEVPALCTVHAEGMALEAQEKRYGQDAVVGLVKMAKPAGTTAFERFTPEGPLALLPFAGDYALVWSAHT